MSTQDGNSLDAKISALGMIVGNQILGSDKNATTPSQQIWADSDSRLASGAQQPFALGAGQSTITAALLNLSGKGTSGILTTTLVNGADVTTVTKGAFIRVNITDDNSVVAPGSYYIQLSTLT